MLEKIIKLDQEIFIFLNNLGTDFWDPFWIFISDQKLIAFVYVIFSFSTPFFIAFLARLLITYPSPSAIFKIIAMCRANL